MNDRRGNLIKWNIEMLDRFEERLITYKIKSKLSILGPFKLRPAVIRYENRNGKISITRSNSVGMSMK
jgi:hypothetical protein